MCVCVCVSVGIVWSVRQRSRRPGLNPCRIIPKTQKCYLMSTCLKFCIMRYELRASGEIQIKEWCPPLLLGIVAI